MPKSKAAASVKTKAGAEAGSEGASVFQGCRAACLQTCDYIHPSVFFGETTRTDALEKLPKHVRSVLTTKATFELLQQGGFNDDHNEDDMEIDETQQEGILVTANGSKHSDNGDASIGDLKQKLHSKIEQLRTARKQRIEEHNKQVKVSGPKRNDNGKTKVAKATAGADGKKKKASANGTSETPAKSAEVSAKRVGEERLISLQTSRIETHDDSALLEKQRRRVAKRIERHKLVGKDYSKLLRRIEHYDETLKKLAESDPKRAERVAERRKLATAIDRAAGLKIKDDPNLIRKSMKSSAARKRKSYETWRARNEEVSKRKEDRQIKRRENLDKRKDSKQKQKVERARKRGRFVISQSRPKTK